MICQYSTQHLVRSITLNIYSFFVLGTSGSLIQITAFNHSCSVVPQHHCPCSPPSTPPSSLFMDMAVTLRSSFSTFETVSISLPITDCFHLPHFHILWFYLCTTTDTLSFSHAGIVFLCIYAADFLSIH